MYQRDSVLRSILFVSVCLFSFNAAVLNAAVYQVGTNQEYHQVENVPWEKLNAGDEVHIHWRPQPYHAKKVPGKQP
jgi:hypothetical protein